MKIYIASRPKHERRTDIASQLMGAGHAVRDLSYPIAQDPETQSEQERSNLAAMEWADALVLIAPAGRNSNIKLGWAIGRGIPAFVLFCHLESRVSYNLVTNFCSNVGEVISRLKEYEDAYAEERRSTAAERVRAEPWPKHEGWGRPTIATEAHYFRAQECDSICQWWFGYNGMRYAPHKILDDGTECQTCIRLLRKGG